MPLTQLDMFAASPHASLPGKTSQEFFQPATTLSAAFWERLPARIANCSRQGANGRTLVVSLDQRGILPGESLMPNISEWPNDAVVCSLSQVLEKGSIHQKYFLSKMACVGILRRAVKRGKKLPGQLAAALQEVADSEPTSSSGGGFSPVAGTLRASNSGSDVDHGIAGYIQPVAYGGNNQSGPIEVATARNACGSGSGRLDFESETFLVQSVSAPVQRSVERPRGDGLDTLIAGTLQANGKAAGSATQQDAESGLLLPIAFSAKDYGGDAAVDLAPTLRAGNHTNSHANGGQPPAIAFDARQDCVSSTRVFGSLGTSSPQAQAVTYPIQNALRGAGQNGLGIGQTDDPMYTLDLGSQHAVCITGDITHTLKAEGFDASEDGTGRGQPIVAHAIQAGALRTNPNSGPDGVGVQANLAYTLEARAEVQRAQMGMAVRRLTPRECERLQTFPDDHTLIPIRKITAKRAAAIQAKGDVAINIDGQWWKLADDGPRYKALGNSMCTENMAWIGRRINRALIMANFTHEREIARVA